MSKIRSRDCHVWLRGLSKLISKFNADTSQDDALTQSGGQIVPWRCSTLRTSKCQNTVARMEYRIWNIMYNEYLLLGIAKNNSFKQTTLAFHRLAFYLSTSTFSSDVSRFIYDRQCGLLMISLSITFLCQHHIAS